MNILFTSDLSGMGGGETSLVNLISVLEKRNNIVVLCATEGKLNTILKEMGIRVVAFNYRDKTSLFSSILKIRKIIKKFNINIIHSNDPLTSVLMYLSAINLDVSNYWTCHGQWYRFTGIKKYLIKHANRHVFCVSTAVETSLKEMGFTKTSVSYLGIPLEKYSKVEPSELRKQYGIGCNTFLVGTVGRFQRIKGQLKMVKAVKMLIEDGYDISYLLIGGCIYDNQEEKEYYSEIVNYIEMNSLKETVILTGEKNNIPEIMHELQLLVVPSDNESFGMVAIEALASGLPIITTPNDGVSEIMMYNKQFVAETNDTEGLYKLVKSYISSSYVQSDAIAFAEFRKNDFQIEKIANKYESMFTLEK
ncbi:glycosyltransferase family 4 protein [Ruminococcus sp. f11]